MYDNNLCFLFFFFNDTATTEIYTLSLHDALPISGSAVIAKRSRKAYAVIERTVYGEILSGLTRSEEHTSELQSQSNLVCRLLLEKKKTAKAITLTTPSIFLLFYHRVTRYI